MYGIYIFQQNMKAAYEYCQRECLKDMFPSYMSFHFLVTDDVVLLTLFIIIIIKVCTMNQMSTCKHLGTISLTLLRALKPDFAL